MNRREFICATGAVAVGLGALPALAAKSATDGLIDVNVSLSRWPARRLPLDETSSLVARLKGQGVVQAWAGSFDGIFYKDLAAANTRLAEESRRNGRGLLVPFGTVNPAAPEWEAELRRCQAEYKMPGVRLFPGYHGYNLADKNFAKLLAICAELGLITQIVVAIEDERMMHPLLRSTGFEVAPLIDQLKACPNARVVLLNWFRSAKGPLITRVAEAGNCSFDIATVEEVGGVGKLLKQVPLSRVVFGSHAPFFYFESAKLKLHESELSAEQLSAIARGNAASLRKSSKI